jgi:hypothetical protein
MKVIRVADAAAGTPPLVAAAALALGILRVTKVTTWAELVAEPSRLSDAALEVSSDQSALLNAHRAELAPLRVSPLVTLAACPVCERWAVVSGGQPAATCSLTLGCTGHPVRASVAARAKDPA